MKNNLNAVDPICEEIYKYEYGTKQFSLNRKRVFKENNLFERYNEFIYYTEYQLKDEIVQITDELLDNIKLEILNRNVLEYNGDLKKQFSVAGILYDKKNKDYIILKSKSERLNGKLTMVQGHAAIECCDDFNVEQAVNDVINDETDNFNIVMNNIIKELEEEICLEKEFIKHITPVYLVSPKDSRVSREHMGVVSVIEIDGAEVKSGEPEKNTVVRMTKEELVKEENMELMDSWLYLTIKKLQEEDLL